MFTHVHTQNRELETMRAGLHVAGMFSVAMLTMFWDGYCSSRCLESRGVSSQMALSDLMFLAPLCCCLIDLAGPTSDLKASGSRALL